MGALACAALAEAPGEAVVFASFTKAIYLSAPSGGVVVLTAPGTPLGPLHIPLPGLPHLRNGDRLAVADGAVRVDATWWQASTPPWSGVVLDRAALAGAAALAAEIDCVPPQLWPDTALTRAESAIGVGDLENAAALLGGLGPGLTPAGDDVLAGVLFAAALGAHPTEVTRLRGIARGVRTNRIAGAFLDAAAQRQCIAPVHDLVGALARGDRTAARQACTAAGHFGATSGQALVYGVLRGLDVFRSGQD